MNSNINIPEYGVSQFNKAIKAFKKTFQLHPSNLESLYILSNLDKKILSSKLKKKIRLCFSYGLNLFYYVLYKS